jgi:hypothetical protein
MENSKLMSIYVHKYFYDMYLHIRRLYSILNNNSDVYYIIGNSTFLELMLILIYCIERYLKCVVLMI